MFNINKDRIMFRFTIGSAKGIVLRAWEPNAPTIAERLACLAYAKLKGFRTSVSMEPMLDGEPHRVINIVRPYVTDSIWLGLMNHASARLRLNKAPQDIIERFEALRFRWDDEAVKNLYDIYRGDGLIKWKDSIKKIIGIPSNTKAGLDL